MGIEKLLPKFLNSDFLFDKAEHFEFARETARIALAPKFFLFSLPSISIRTLSIFFDHPPLILLIYLKSFY